ncbi:hypothetical protein AALN73_16370 [Bacteroides stercorirosoris]|jgi:hypothetical protein|uniref:Calx-beta domain-containing protein n=2 Tax=Bacteroides stercorirosoris TaxID=871324 RepID=A0A1M6LDP7_9BACE|nr:hypothetical protein [Bacteroides stercorirosoris]SHJ69330.1 hypothetical protein SAMN05444350_14713 [Bacteroides stercorirosoris]
MNKIKNILSAMLLLALPLAFTACGDDVEYSPADKPVNAQVYFPTTNGATVDLSKDKTSFDVTLMRAKTDEAITVPITATGGGSFFTIPTSVSFAQGVDKAVLSISYNPESLEYDAYSEIKLTIGDESATTPYGMAQYVFKAGIPAPWTSLGKATFSDAFLFANKYSVELQRNDLNPSLYRLVDPYSEGLTKEGFTSNGDQSPYVEFTLLKPGDKIGDVTITMEDLVYFPYYCTGFFNTSNDYNTNVDAHHPSDFSSLNSEAAWTFNRVLQYQADGTPAGVQLAPYYYMNGHGGWNNTQADGIITIIFPGASLKDYTINVEYKGRFTNVGGDNYAVADIQLGADVENAKVVMVEGNDIQAAINGILDGSLEGIEVSQSGSVNIPSTANGLCSIVAVGYGEGESQEVAYTSFEFSAGTDRWMSLGTALYTEDLMTTLYKVDNPTYEVEIQENSENPGVYRLVNPYGEAYPYNESGDWDDSQNHYLVINAQDPEGVFIDQQKMGLNWGDGALIISSLAANYLGQGATLEEVKAKGVCGSLTDGVITFPVKSLLCTLESETSFYYGNINGAFKVVLPDAAATVQTQATTKSVKALGVQSTDKKAFSPSNKVSSRELKFGIVTSHNSLNR